MIKWLPYILIYYCVSLSLRFIILDKNNFVNISHHYHTSGDITSVYSQCHVDSLACTE